jgi:hypothetical protein
VVKDEFQLNDPPIIRENNQLTHPKITPTVMPSSTVTGPTPIRQIILEWKQQVFGKYGPMIEQ